MVLGGLFSPTVAAVSVWYKPKDALVASKLAWAAWSFQVFSFACLFAAAVGDVRSFNRRRYERAIVILCGSFVGLTQFLSGYALADYEDEETAAVGKFFMRIGILWGLVMPPSFFYVVSMWNALDDIQLSDAVTNGFKSLLFSIGSITYLAAGSMRCILGADDESPVYQQCANPVRPAYNINVLLFVTWVSNVPTCCS